MAKKLLLIEDSLSIQALVASAFEPEEVDIIVADNAADGLHKAQTMAPDMVLADAAMPDIDGFQLCHRIRQTSYGRHIPIVLLTSSFAVYDAAKGDLAGVTTHLGKPFASHTLVDLVKQCLTIVPRPLPSPSTPASPPRSPVLAAGQTTEPSGRTALSMQTPSPLPAEPEQWTETPVDLGTEIPIPAVMRDIVENTPETRIELSIPATCVQGTQDTPGSEPPPTRPSPEVSSQTPDDISLAFYHALGSRFEQMLRETLEAHLHSAFEPLLPQILAAAQAVIAEKIPDMLADLLQQEIDKLKRAVERESEPG